MIKRSSEYNQRQSHISKRLGIGPYLNLFIRNSKNLNITRSLDKANFKKVDDESKSDEEEQLFKLIAIKELIITRKPQTSKLLPKFDMKNKIGNKMEKNGSQKLIDEIKDNRLDILEFQGKLTL